MVRQHGKPQQGFRNLEFLGAASFSLMLTLKEIGADREIECTVGGVTEPGRAVPATSLCATK